MAPPPPPGNGPPPPPPPPGGGTTNATPLPAPSNNRNALLSQIQSGTQLKKAVTNDRSSPTVSTPKSSFGGGSLTQTASTGTEMATGVPPQLGGLFARGMPKLKSRGGGLDTEADHGTSDGSSNGTPARGLPKPLSTHYSNSTGTPTTPVTPLFATAVPPTLPNRNSSGRSVPAVPPNLSRSPAPPPPPARKTGPPPPPSRTNGALSPAPPLTPSRPTPGLPNRASLSPTVTASPPNRTRPPPTAPTSTPTIRAPEPPATEGRWTFRIATDFPSPMMYQNLGLKVYPSGNPSGTAIPLDLTGFAGVSAGRVPPPPPVNGGFR